MRVFLRAISLEVILGELLASAPVIEKQPSAAVKRNVEKYAVPAVVSLGRLFPVRPRITHDRTAISKGGEVEIQKPSLKSNPSEKISCARPAINRMTYYRWSCNLGLTKKCASYTVAGRGPRTYRDVPKPQR